MLPFLKQKPVAGVIIEKRKAKDGSIATDMQPESSEDAGIESCADALIKAISAKDAKATARALKDAFDILESQPDAEAESMEEENS